MQLWNWRNRLVDPVLALEAVNWVDLDIAENRIAIGILDASGRTAVKEILAEMGIPARGGDLRGDRAGR